MAVLASGSGTLLEAMLQANLPIALVASDRKCRGLEIADAAGVTSVLVERTDWSSSFDRDAYARDVLAVLNEHEIDLVAMAGFGTVLGASIFAAMPGRIINTHPALLPAFPGWHAVRQALDYGVKITGCTIHVATPAVDDGPILAQEAVAVEPDDDEASLHERIKVVERRLYVETIKDIHARGRVL
ncbi:MAG: phosphoribosylglycinamide formyltransferase [Acidimicrobiia bacterium]|nr:phosphoribosylglycinamide formyltransferase [Acidimicrobiia bacterium]